ncbi:MAG: DUF4376 domain-containing protein [Ruminococcus sp.]|nr:DUF4376 domain-containing protein [Ruminococcus sp.]
MNLNDKYYKCDYSDEAYQQVLRDATYYCITNNYSLEEGEDDRGYYVVIMPIVEPPRTLDDLKVGKKADIAAARYNYEIAGVIINGIHITTDREDQAMITAVALSAVVDPNYTTVWKGADGYLTLNAAEILAMARIVGAHVEAAFAEEKRLAEQIDAAQTEEELASIIWTLS